jgi:adenine-specific DNA-methyltransferase
LAKKNKYVEWSKEDLVKRIEALEKRKKYGLVWDEERTKEKFEADAEGKLPVLKEVKAKHIKTDPEKPTHILIEGDNYHALSVLNYTHERAIDLIFIDPPYNLGGDFMYNDKIIDKEDSYRHSKWLSFMKKRLILARNLLKTTGAIFITIDDNEAAHLKVLCDDIFHQENFIGQICWQKKFSPQNDATYFSDMHDFILVYAKKAKTKKSDEVGFNLVGLSRTDEMNQRYSNPDNDPRGDWTSSDCTVKTYSKDYDYPIKTPSGRVVNPPGSRCWFTSKTRMQALVEDNRIWFGENGKNVPRVKCFISEVKERITPTTWWTHDEVGHNQEAKQELKQILPDAENVFDTPKPVRLLKRILELSTISEKPTRVLDFFAGSGTTLQAVLELNELDGGMRQCIIVTNNENRIATDVCYPRVERTIKGYKFEGTLDKLIFEEKLTLTKLKQADIVYARYKQARENNEKLYDELKGEFKNNTIRLWGIKNNVVKKPGTGGNLKYYRTAFIPSTPTDKNKELLTKEAVEMLCLRENTFDLVSENETIKIFSNQDHYTGIIFDQLSISKFKKIASKFGKPVSVYVFSLGDDDFADEFADMKKVKVCSIPEAILRVYRRIFQ